MQRTLKRTLAFAALLAVGALFGCHKAETAATTTAPTTAAAPQGAVAGGLKAQNNRGGVADPNSYPAPSGIKTGVQPGGAANK